MTMTSNTRCTSAGGSPKCMLALSTLMLIAFHGGSVESFATVPPKSHPSTNSNHHHHETTSTVVLRQSSVAIDVPTSSPSSPSSASSVAERRRKKQQKQQQQQNVFEPVSVSASAAPSATSSTSRTTNDVIESTAAELRTKDLKQLKLECSRRSMKYSMFKEKHDFINAIIEDMKSSLRFSATGLVRPGAVADLAGDQLEVEIASQQSGSSDEHTTPILVDCYAPWCGPCKMVVPQLQAAAKQFGSDVRVVKVDSDKFPGFASKYQVEALPTMMLFQNGQVVDRLEGAHMTETIINLVENHNHSS
eukprot:CAMPEP_0113500912 /NCGR_PEP_ID=MMETSP0014_2-20120614/32630_1 /TAXON_ID=2857 /ORGANISM="Nitzschia sp." /LENGTH=304 /DNA_ID=CAMNT_0000395377 /DNA_START=123 /DNA_END=1037 /DNA_ORIENTATION=+ /assembly_acc=CAM_ASM_000159